MVEKDDFQAVASKLLEQQNLVSKIACQAVRTVDVQPVERALGQLIAQAFQVGPQQRAAAAAVVDEFQFWINPAAVRLNALTQRRELAGDRALLDLAIARHA